MTILRWIVLPLPLYMFVGVATFLYGWWFLVAVLFVVGWAALAAYLNYKT